MSELQRLIITFKAGELVIHTLYRRDPAGPGPGTKARRREVSELTRSGLTQALEALEGDVAVVGESGFTTREDVIVVDCKERIAWT